jgi:hypothetical protein
MIGLFGSPLQGFCSLNRFSQGGATLAPGWYVMTFQAIRIVDKKALKTGMHSWERVLGRLPKVISESRDRTPP